MRKFLGLLCLLGMSFLLDGCDLFGAKEDKKEEETTTPEETKSTEVVLRCSKTTKEDDVNFVTTMSYYFKDDKIVNLGVKYNYDLSIYDADTRALFSSSKMCDTEELKTQLGMVDCKEQLSGNNYIVEGYAKKLLEDAEGTFEQVKQVFDSDGWSCTTEKL